MRERQRASTTVPMPFLMILSADHVTGAVGVTPIVAISKSGGTFAAPGGAVTEINISAPTFPGGVFTAAASTGGSLLQTTTYFYKITSTTILGETTPGTEQSYTVPTSGTNTNKITINWNAVTDATGYKVYRSIASNGELLLATIVGGGTVSYVDSTATVPAGTYPTSNTTGCGWYNLAGNATDRNTFGQFIIHASAAGCDPSDTEYMMVGYDPFDAVHLGITALPNAAAAATGGLPTVDANNSVKLQTGTGANQISLTSGNVSLAVTPPTAVQVATAVWTDLTGSDFTVTGSPGKILVGQLGGTFTTTTSSVFSTAALANATGSDPWATTLPGAYTSSQAGAILNKNVSGGVLIATTSQTLNFNNTGQTTPVPSNMTQFNGVAANAYDGIAIAGTANTITLSDTDTQAAGNVAFRTVTIVGGTGIGQSKVILSVATVSTHRVATVDSNWTINPDNTSQYALSATSVAYSVLTGSGGPTAAQIATAVWQDTTGADFTVIGSPGKTVVGQLQGAFINASASVFSTPALANAPTGGGGGPTASQIATAVWTDTTGSDFTVIGSPGKTVVGQVGGTFINASASIFSSASLVNTPNVWLKDLGTGYTGTQAGNLLNTRPTAAQISTSVWTDVTGSDFTVVGSPGQVLIGQVGGTFTTNTSSVFTAAALVNATSTDPWLTTLPGSYTGSQAGSILFNKPTAAQVATSVWTDSTGSDFTVIGSPGQTLNGQVKGMYTTNISSILTTSALINGPGGAGVDPWSVNLSTGGYSGDQAGALVLQTPNNTTGVILASGGMDRVPVEVGLNMRQAQTINTLALVSILQGVPPAGSGGTILIKNLAGNVTRITTAVDGSGNRTGTALNPPT